jgi:hypothetical protein
MGTTPAAVSPHESCREVAGECSIHSGKAYLFECIVLRGTEVGTFGTEEGSFSFLPPSSNNTFVGSVVVPQTQVFWLYVGGWAVH